MKRKARGDSRIEGLPENQREAVWRWLSEEGVGYDQALERLYKDFGVRVGRSSLARWYGRRVSEGREERALELIVESARKANVVLEECGRNPAPLQKAMLEFVSRIAFEQAVKMGEELDAKALKEFALMALKGRREDREDVKLAIRKQELALDTERFERETCELFLKWYGEERARGIAESQASNAEKIARLREAYFADIEALEKSGTVKLPK